MAFKKNNECKHQLYINSGCMEFGAFYTAKSDQDGCFVMEFV